MKINTVLVDRNIKYQNQLLQLIKTYCPILNLLEPVTNLSDLIAHDDAIELIFINHANELDTSLQNKSDLLKKAEYISCYEALNKCNTPLNTFSPCGYLSYPINEKLLILVVESARKKILLKKSIEKVKMPTNIVAIPTINELEFIAIEDIIRCEGLTNCTRIVTKSSKKDIISSYNIGEFKKLLCSHSFYSPHKSHLVNLAYISQYKREGIIHMANDSRSMIPVARSKRQEFLGLINRI
ncbi:MAG: LytTR family DNA-binding domain-containing protein [Bacteroidota bacterium]